MIVAIGFFDVPNRLDVPGQDLPKVTHYYTEPYRYVRQKVAIVGAKNSAAKAALDCHRHGAEVTLVVRAPALSDKIKYWIKPDLENRIKEGSIRAYFDTAVDAIRETSIVLRTPGGVEEIANDWVVAMTGYRPDYRFLEALDIAIADDVYRTPVFDEATFETSRPGTLPRRHGLRRLPHQPLVHRERTFSRRADRQAHHAKGAQTRSTSTPCTGRRRNRRWALGAGRSALGAGAGRRSRAGERVQRLRESRGRNRPVASR